MIMSVVLGNFGRLCLKMFWQETSTDWLHCKSKSARIKFLVNKMLVGQS